MASKRRTIAWAAGILAVAFLSWAGVAAIRGKRAIDTARDWRAQIRYLVETGQSVGESPASEALSADYLEAIFGDNPELLDKLKTVVQRGLDEEPSLNLGEVAAMIVTYHRTPDGKVEDVVAHAVGGFPLGKRRPGFHRDGYFRGKVDSTLWNAGNLVVGFLGRDIVLFAEEGVARTQQQILESLFSGDITPLIVSLQKPMHYTIVFPDPRRLVPPQLRNHVQAVVIKGELGYDEGRIESILLCPSQRSSEYTLSILADMKRMADLALKARFGGVVVEREWGPMVVSWWALEMANTLEKATLKRELTIVRARTDFGRVMVNVVLKSVERMSRDLAQMRLSFDDRIHPLVVDEKLSSRHPSHYWSTPHEWGPNWPIPPPDERTNGFLEAVSPVSTEAKAASPTPDEADGAVQAPL